MADEDIWTVRRMLDWMCGYLERKGDENPRLSAQWLLSHATGLSRIELYADIDRPIAPEERDVLRDHVARRAQGEPLQYLTGSAPFRYLTVNVRPGVLIPRPETEVLVSEVLALLPSPERIRSREFLAELAEDAGEPSLGDDDGASMSDLVIETRSTYSEEAPDDARDELLVADIGTGSGCIACSLATEHPRIRVVATDVSSDALAVARENAEANDVVDRIDFYEGDLGEAVPHGLTGRFAAIASNPPYIPADVLSAMPPEVTRFEPDLALAGGTDGLDPFRRLAPWAYDALAPDGFFACELHETTLDAAADIARSAGFAETRIVHDLAGKPRVLIAHKARTMKEDAHAGE